MGCTKGAPAEQALGELAEWLTLLRQRSGLTYSQMAHASVEMGLPVSIGTLFRADKGRSLPAWPTVHAYVRSCGGTVGPAKRLWGRAARAKLRGPHVTAPPPVRVVPALPYITEPAELLQAMRELRLSVGQPSLRILEVRAAVPGGGGSFLPHSTLGGVLNGTRSCTRELLKHFVAACGVHRRTDLQQWVAAWNRVERYRSNGAAHTYARAC
ncbi:hypothetical protein [Streptomyces purpurogeneiscleroticus]|uniref:hypothetical protein n=1 Tax=Streptomyces purpurogeneiscleroticus TaxID=68259 RepID=UPI001CBEE825|nr:hypothetical protein [Streptomyces purpurogeneiscleroticus]